MSVAFEMFPRRELISDVRGLASPVSFRIPLWITNSETITLYFRLRIVNPSPDWTTHTSTLGSVSAGSTALRLATLARVIPDMSAGFFTETITLRLEAFGDSAYSQLYGYMDIPVTVELIDSGNPNVTVSDQTDFGSGTFEGFTRSKDIYVQTGLSVYPITIELVSSPVVSPPLALRVYTLTSDTYRSAVRSYVVPSTSRRYISFYVYATDSTFAVALRQETEPIFILYGALWDTFGINRWLKFCVKLPTSDPVMLILQGAGNYNRYLTIDDVRVFGI